MCWIFFSWVDSLLLKTLSLCPRLQVAMPATASRYFLPVLSNSQQPFPFLKRYIESTIGIHQSRSGRTWTDIPEGAAFWVRCVYQFHHAPKAFQKMNFFIITKINLLTIFLVKEELSKKRLLIVNLVDKNIELFIAFADKK